MLEQPPITYIENEEDLQNYLEQLNAKQVREVSLWMGFSPSENIFTLNQKIIDAFSTLAKLTGIETLTEAYRDGYNHVPTGVTDLLDWRDQCVRRLQLNDHLLFEALEHWQLSLF